MDIAREQRWIGNPKSKDEIATVLHKTFYSTFIVFLLLIHQPYQLRVYADTLELNAMLEFVELV